MIYGLKLPNKVTAKYLEALITKYEEEVNDLINITDDMWKDFVAQLQNNAPLLQLCLSFSSNNATLAHLINDPERVYYDFIRNMASDAQNNYKDYNNCYPILLEYFANAINKYK